LAYSGKGKFIENKCFGGRDSATEYWLFQEPGESYRLTWWNNGWVVSYQESYLTKDHKFEHKDDIKSFSFSHHGSSIGWKHVFQTREDAIWNFKLAWVKIREGEGDVFDSIKEIYNSL